MHNFLNLGAAIQEQSYFCEDSVDIAAPAVHWLKIFNTMAAGLLTVLLVLLTSCTAIKAPKTLFITFGVSETRFKDESEELRIFLDRLFEKFKRSNPDTNLVYINYKSKNIFKQIERDNALSLGPDLVVAEQFSAPRYSAHGLTTILPNQQDFNTIYSPRIQAAAKTNDEYTFAPFLISTQIACFNRTTIKKSPSTIDELKKISASGKKIGLSSDLYQLIWTAGTQGAIAELSSIGRQRASNPTYPAIKKWLQWIETAALYQNISFHENQRELSNKLKNNELDWVTCHGIQLGDLKKTMGHSLGVSALPNGTTSKAFPTHITYGFSLGKNSSQTQRDMAMKFIMANVNTIAQRKLELDNTGFLAANQNVFIPAESSKILTALNTSFHEQRKNYAKKWPGILRWFEPEKRSSKNFGKRYLQLRRTLTDFTNGYIDNTEALKIITTPQTN